MKKFISLFLLFSLLLPSVGTFIWFKFQQKEIRKEVKKQLIAGVNESELTLLIFSVQETQTLLTWKHDKEFSFEGIMYDIVKQKIENNTYYFWCWKDHKETSLYKKLDTLVASALGNDSSQQQKQIQIKLFNQTLIFNTSKTWKPTFFAFSPKSKIYNYFPIYKSLSPIPQVPPPLFV
ncbi:MAG TPA: hypothetical protein DCS66_04310 [Flavobacteriaceae bacterium]|nr:hypothetical protein [Flavobacteriaceae bacterium]HAT63813.1 hypothetical protein [Flavobacteriaceae bacterium]